MRIWFLSKVIYNYYTNWSCSLLSASDRFRSCFSHEACWALLVACSDSNCRSKGRDAPDTDCANSSFRALALSSRCNRSLHSCLMFASRLNAKNMSILKWSSTIIIWGKASFEMVKVVQFVNNFSTFMGLKIYQSVHKAMLPLDLILRQFNPAHTLTVSSCLCLRLLSDLS